MRQQSLSFSSPAKRQRVDSGKEGGQILASEKGKESFQLLNSGLTPNKPTKKIGTSIDTFFSSPSDKGDKSDNKSDKGDKSDNKSDNGDKSEDIVKEAVLAVKDGPSPPLSAQQRERCELNRAIARARRAIRICETRTAAAKDQGLSFPNLEDLLVEDSWRAEMGGELKKAYAQQLQKFILQEASGKIPIYPPPQHIFRAFNTCPFDEVKVVIIGQDPYHGSGQAMGLSFSVPEGVKCPSSLQNIYREIHSDVGCSVPKHGNLEKWAAQGVLLLNTVLTVRAQQAASHAKKGWEPFTDAAIRALALKRKGIVFLLWGNHAQEKGRMIDSTSHHVLKAPHPSGLSAHRGFIGCKHFSKTNAFLEATGKAPIDWQL